MKIRISPEAEQDLVEIFDYILADNPLAANKTLDVIYREIHHLSEHPNSGELAGFPEPGNWCFRALLSLSLTR